MRREEDCEPESELDNDKISEVELLIINEEFIKQKSFQTITFVNGIHIVSCIRGK